MKHFGFFLILGIVLLSLQVVWGKFIPFPPARPDFTLAFTLYLGFTSSSFIGGSLAFALGYLTDLFTGNVFGFYALTRPLLFYGVQLYRSRLNLDGFVFQSLLGWVTAFLEGCFVVFLMMTLNATTVPNLYSKLFRLLLPQSVATGIVAPFVFILLNRTSAFVFYRSKVGLKR